MRIGKLTNEELQENVLSLLKRRRNEVIVYPEAGEDCAVIRAIEGLVFLSGDPITGTTSDMGALAVHINCNDIAASGAEPLGIMLTIMLPPSLDTGFVKKIMESAESVCATLKIDILGGHTEFTSAVNTPVISAVAVGMARKIIRSKTMEEGDFIVMTKTAGIEGTWLIAADRMDALREKYTDKLFLTEDEEKEAIALFKKISVLPESRIMARHEVSSMHDMTEGGVYGAVSEMCFNRGLGAEIETRKIPVLPVTLKICKLMKIDPYRLLSSGSMLCTCKRPKPLLESLSTAGLPAVIIGRITGEGVYAIGKKGIRVEIKSGKDEINKFTEN